jgi:copper transport protein
VIRALALALAALALLPATAGAHALLEGTMPERGARLDAAPEQVGLRFSEPVEAEFGAVRVFDSSGREVQEGRTFHPGGRGAEVAVRLRSGLGEDGYTVTYRVISADSHPVSGGFVFVVGDAPAPSTTVGELLGDDDTGAVIGTAFGVARAVQFASIALGLGALIFALFCWLPGLRATAGAGAGWEAASTAFSGRLRALLLIAAAAGALSAVVAIVLQGAVAGGTGVGAALDPDVIGDVLGTRFGVFWAFGVAAWLLVGVLAAAPRPVPVLRPAAVGATGLALPPTTRLAALAVPLTALAALPALGGHASVQSPAALLTPANILHVIAMSAWLGGVAVLVLVLRAATARLEATERTRLLAAVVARFSALAGVAIAVLLASGIVQGLVEVRTVPNLVETAFGRAVLIKIVLFAGIVALGWVNRRRLLPALARAAREGEPPGHAGLLLRRTLRAELALGLRALGRRGPGPVHRFLGHRTGAARADRRPGADRAERDARVPLRPRRRQPVRRDEGAHRDRRAAREADRADRVRADQGRPRALRDIGRNARRRGRLDGRDRRTNQRLRRVSDEDSRTSPLIVGNRF